MVACTLVRRGQLLCYRLNRFYGFSYVRIRYITFKRGDSVNRFKLINLIVVTLHIFLLISLCAHDLLVTLLRDLIYPYSNIINFTLVVYIIYDGNYCMQISSNCTFHRLISHNNYSVNNKPEIDGRNSLTVGFLANCNSL